MTDRTPKFEETGSRLRCRNSCGIDYRRTSLGLLLQLPIKLALMQHLGENRVRAGNGAFVYRLGRKILILERGVRLP